MNTYWVSVSAVQIIADSPLLACSLEWLLHGGQKMHACQEPNDARVLFSLMIWTRSEDQHGDLWLLARLLVAVHWRGPEIWPLVWILHQDCTSAQDMLSPPPKMLMRWDYPDLAFCFFWLFPELWFGEATEFQTLSAFQDMHWRTFLNRGFSSVLNSISQTH